MITEEEYNELVKEGHGAVARLEDYDSMRQRIAELEAERDRAWKERFEWQEKAGEWLTERDVARDENVVLRKALFAFAELPTVGADDAVDLDADHPQPVSNRMILEARGCFKPRVSK